MIMSTETPIILTPITQLKNTVIIKIYPKNISLTTASNFKSNQGY